MSGGLITTLGTLTLTVGTTPVSGSTNGQLLAVSGGVLSQPTGVKVVSNALQLKAATNHWYAPVAPDSY